jgi:release factor glutamine methyltransferase
MPESVGARDLPETIFTTRAAALQWARQSIDRLDARLLLQAISGVDAAALLAYPETALSAAEIEDYRARVTRRAAGEPLAYLTGEAGFYGEMLTVSPAVLVPRPETEDLVTWALVLLAGRTGPQVADLGTGSGAIALALAGQRPDAQVLAVDISADALAIAERNRQRLARNNVALRRASWFDAYPDDPVFDLVVSNPPYIPVADSHLVGDGVRFEPRAALTDEADGLEAYRALALQAVPRLKPGGWLLVEHGHDQAETVAALWRDAGLVAVESRQDLSGNPRMTAGRKALGGEHG